MSPAEFVRRRLDVFRDRMRPAGIRSPGRIARRHWPWLSLLTLALAGALTLDVWLFTCGFQGCPSTAEIRRFRAPEGGRILDRNGRLVGRLEVVRRVNVPIDSVPKHVRAAFVATEDRHFFQHNGIDWHGFLRALVRNIASGGVREGFSTITMQVARNSFAATERFGQRTLGKKLIEMRLARLIERSLTKNQILELYLNVIYLGNGVYGIEAASRDLFGTGVSRASVAEGAVLAALPKAPSGYTPRRHPARALARRNIVLALMAREGYISPREAEQAARARLVVARREWRPVQPDDNFAFDAVRDLVDSVTAALGEDLPEAVVYTTLDMTAQRAADAVVRRHAAAIGRGVEGAMVALDPRSGDIRALVGGTAYERGAFDRALAARRQPGSAFKPFVYAAALAAGYTPSTQVDDSPVEIVQGRQVWSPANYNGEYLGSTTLVRALEKSANAATVRVSHTIGERRVIDVARRSGIVSKLTPVPAIALGALEVTPLELVAAYAPFANGGSRVAPRLVRRIERVDGSVLWESAPQLTPVMDPRDAFELTSMLRSVVEHGTGRAVREAGVQAPVAGKTGTTNNGSDVWFVGYTPTIVAGVWFGYDAPRGLGPNPSGGHLAAPAWADWFARGCGGCGGEWTPPPGMVARAVDPETGYLANDYCPLRERLWYRAGSEPTELCPVHTAPPPPPISTDGDSVSLDTLGNIVRDVGRGISKIWSRIFKR